MLTMTCDVMPTWKIAGYKLFLDSLVKIIADGILLDWV